MIVSMIVAMGKNRAIGKDNQLLWRLSGDLKKFKSTTMGHHMLMGRKTFDSIGRALPGRTSIILTRDTSYTQADCLIAYDLEMAIELARKNNETELFIIGGGQIYDLSFKSIDKLYLTEVDCELEADTFFPSLNFEDWNCIVEELYTQDDKNQYNWAYKVFDRK